MTMDEKLDALVAAFRADSTAYKQIKVGSGRAEKQTILRSLMNIRAPGMMDEAVLEIQDAYLRQRAAEKGIVTLQDIPTLRERYSSQSAFAGTLSIWQGDITRLGVDAIVNAANHQMLGCFRPMHNCIDNCIHTYAGIQLRAECDQKMQRLRLRYGTAYTQPTAIPMLTDAYNLPAKKVIHVVGPIVSGSLTRDLEQSLSDCYRNVLDMCRENRLSSVAFCCISTGVFSFPNRRAAEIAVETVTTWLADHPDAMERVIFNVFRDEDLAHYEKLLRP